MQTGRDGDSERHRERQRWRQTTRDRDTERKKQAMEGVRGVHGEEDGHLRADEMIPMARTEGSKYREGLGWESWLRGQGPGSCPGSVPKAGDSGLVSTSQSTQISKVAVFVFVFVFKGQFKSPEGDQEVDCWADPGEQSRDGEGGACPAGGGLGSGTCGKPLPSHSFTTGCPGHL